MNCPFLFSSSSFLDTPSNLGIVGKNLRPLMPFFIKYLAGKCDWLLCIHLYLRHDMLTKQGPFFNTARSRNMSNLISSILFQIATEESELKTCASCKRARYCDKVCQQKDWKGHKLLHKELELTKKVLEESAQKCENVFMASE